MSMDRWIREREPGSQLRDLLEKSEEPGVMVIQFNDATMPADPVKRRFLKRWTSTRAITAADISGRLVTPALDIALLCDLVYVRESALMVFPPLQEGVPPGLMWALHRAGPQAFAHGVLEGEQVSARQACDLGFADGLLASGDPVPIGEAQGLNALTAGRDLLRARATGAVAEQLELATFRFLFACGEPVEGARAFLEKRAPNFKSFLFT